LKNNFLALVEEVYTLKLNGVLTFVQMEKIQ